MKIVTTDILLICRSSKDVVITSVRVVVVIDSLETAAEQSLEMLDG